MVPTFRNYDFCPRSRRNTRSRGRNAQPRALRPAFGPPLLGGVQTRDSLWNEFRRPERLARSSPHSLPHPAHPTNEYEDPQGGVLSVFRISEYTQHASPHLARSQLPQQWELTRWGLSVPRQTPTNSFPRGSLWWGFLLATDWTGVNPERIDVSKLA